MLGRPLRSNAISQQLFGLVEEMYNTVQQIGANPDRCFLILMPPAPLEAGNQNLHVSNATAHARPQK